LFILNFIKAFFFTNITFISQKYRLRGFKKNKKTNISLNYLVEFLTVGNNTRALKYTRINPISLPNTESTDPPRRTGANSKKINEINPRIMYRA